MLILPNWADLTLIIIVDVFCVIIESLIFFMFERRVPSIFHIYLIMCGTLLFWQYCFLKSKATDSRGQTGRLANSLKNNSTVIRALLTLLARAICLYYNLSGCWFSRVSAMASSSKLARTRFCKAGHHTHGSQLSLWRGESSRAQAIITRRGNVEAHLACVTGSAFQR